MGSAVLGFLRFWYDFIVGDDWTVAAAVIASVAVTGLLAHRSVNVWWLLPAVVFTVLAVSVARADRQRRSKPR